MPYHKASLSGAPDLIGDAGGPRRQSGAAHDQPQRMGTRHRPAHLRRHRPSGERGSSRATPSHSATSHPGGLRLAPLGVQLSVEVAHGRRPLPDAGEPGRELHAPREKNANRPVATEDRHEQVRTVSDQVTMMTRWGTEQEQRSYLSEILDIIDGTGRRLSAVCKLTCEDQRLQDGPHGAIRWPASTDKTGTASLVPISRAVRAAIERILKERPGIGNARSSRPGTIRRSRSPATSQMGG